MKFVQTEISTMKRLKHPHIIEMIELVETPETLYLVLELTSGGELFERIVQKGHLSEAQTARIIGQVLEAIHFVHSNGFAHRDLKPEHILFATQDGEDVKLTGFDLAKNFEENTMGTSVGTPDYVAPEVLGSGEYDSEIDIWSIGVITYVMLCGYLPFQGSNQQQLFHHIIQGQYSFPGSEWNKISEDAKNFIQKMLVVNPDERYTAQQCLEDKWIKSREIRT